MSTAVLQPPRHPLDEGHAPTWASGWGEDRYGVFADLTVGEITQRMRWIPPGWFWMGSPDTEAGRYSNEGPRHRITLTQGFWLGDTPCTQALWEAVMGENPSRFQSPDRPVEQVSWEDAQRFFEALDARVPGFEGRFPTEAEWEYACRAGTETATYAGEMEILGAYHAPVLDPIAWYGGNSGLDFELENGRDSSDWPEKQYPHTRAGTHPVAQKVPNAWGLYDVLGNVWEWCEDGAWRDYTADAVVDPLGPTEAALRVIRGGSWYGHARFVRAAFRAADPPGLRHGHLGFRLARGQRLRSSGRSPE